MTPHEKAVNALNARLERLQANLRAATTESARQFLLQSIVVSIGVSEALNDYIKQVGEYARLRHAGLKQAHDTLGTQHADLLNSGRALLEQLKANPTDRALRKEIERVQREMEVIQKTVRRGANTLQRELAPSLALLDELADSVRRFAEAEQGDALKRVLTRLITHTRELYSAQPTLRGKTIIDAAAWEQSAVSELAQAVDLYDAFARAGYQAILAFDLMAMALSENPPQSAEEAATRANTGVAERVKAITARFTTS